MRSPTRRAFLKGSAAAAAGAAVSIPAIASVGPDHPDAELLQAIETYHQKQASLEEVCKRYEGVTGHKGIEHERRYIDPAHAAMSSAYFTALEIPATTSAGLLAKLQMIEVYMNGDNSQWDEREADPIMADVRRVLGRAGS